MESRLKIARELLYEKKPDIKAPIDVIRHYEENRQKGIKIFESLAKSDLLSSEEKLNVIEIFCKSSSEDGEDVINTWRDSIPHLRGDEKTELLRLLTLVCLSPNINSFFRLNIAITFYNNGELTLSYDCFSDLAQDNSVMIEHRIEAAKYLFVSNSDSLINISKEVILDVIQIYSLPSEYRYDIIASFISPTTVIRIRSIFNSEKLSSYYDEEFVRDLQVKFFSDDRNGMRQRILSGQHILQIENIDDYFKNEVVEFLLDFASNIHSPEIQAADAADVVLRLGGKIQAAKARDIIINLGRSTVGTKARDSTIYTDSQNVHNKSINTFANEFIEKMIKASEQSGLRSFADVHREVGDYVRSVLTDLDDRNKAYRSLNRISIDTATFTKSRITIAEIFVHVWMRIKNADPEVINDMKMRMINELVDMSGTCSSGHSARLVNVLSVYDSTLRISWEDQVKANVSGRMNAYIKNSGDQMREQIAVGMFEDADNEDRKIAKHFIDEKLEELYKILYNEFVEEGYLKETEFQRYFTQSSKRWRLK